MARFERRAVLQSIENPRIAEAQQRSALADRLQAFGEVGLKSYKDMRLSQARKEAGQTEVRAGVAPELKSESTLYGKQFNKIMLQSHAAETRNAWTRRLNELSLEHPNDVVAFSERANAYTSELLNSVPPEMREFTRIDMDASMDHYAHGIRARQAKENLELGILEADKATNRLKDDAMTDLRNGRDDVFLARRQAYMNAVYSQDQYSPLMREKKMQAFDREADAMYHIGEVERMLERGEMAGAIKYKNKLARGEYKTFGNVEADRDAVMSALDQQINGYYTDYTRSETIMEAQRNQWQQDNFNELMQNYVAGKSEPLSIQNAFTDGKINWQQYATAKAFQSSNKATVTDPTWKFNFIANVGTMSQMEQRAWVTESVVKKLLNPDEGAAYLLEIEQGKYTPLETQAAKIQLQRFKTAVGITEMMDPTKAENVTRADAYTMLQESILEGVDPKEAYDTAFQWYRDTDPYSYLTEQFTTRGDIEAEMRSINRKVKTGKMKPPEAAARVQRLNELKRQMGGE